MIEVFEECYSLKEQLYTTSRAYWIGTKFPITDTLPLSTKFTKKPMIWLTPHKSLAMSYCLKDDYSKGALYKVKLHKYLHIFNARSYEDQVKLRMIMPEITKKEMQNLANIDFLYYQSEDGSFKGRNNIIDSISKIKYGKHDQFECDGLLNFEKTSLAENLNPGLGLFSTNSFDIREAFEPKEYEEEQKFFEQMSKKNKPDKEWFLKFKGLK